MTATPDFLLVIKKVSEEGQRKADNMPFNLIIGDVFITRKGYGGKYVAFYHGQEIEAITDGSNELGDDGLFHFSLDDNPLG